ncbi:TPA: class I SAM-dependent methyltransferase, partial [Corynebacterium striatum]|nr:class I SAM-dependent methyltransferase [Corynebacterium striatum]
MPAWLAENLKELEVVKLDKRERRVEGGAGAHHSHDVVLVAKRPTEAAG